VTLEALRRVKDRLKVNLIARGLTFSLFLFSLRLSFQSGLPLGSWRFCRWSNQFLPDFLSIVTVVNSYQSYLKQQQMQFRRNELVLKIPKRETFPCLDSENVARKTFLMRIGSYLIAYNNWKESYTHLQIFVCVNLLYFYFEKYTTIQSQ